MNGIRFKSQSKGPADTLHITVAAVQQLSVIQIRLQSNRNVFVSLPKIIADAEHLHNHPILVIPKWRHLEKLQTFLHLEMSKIVCLSSGLITLWFWHVMIFWKDFCHYYQGFNVHINILKISRKGIIFGFQPQPWLTKQIYTQFTTIYKVALLTIVIGTVLFRHK